tara:strand:- start:517 stop:693 length:177 start_codon:yes stop_codon:yes gene_type:complete
MQVGTGNKPHTEISKRLHLCKICGNVWEIDYQTRKTLYYQEFPTYKLERKKCKQCKKE